MKCIYQILNIKTGKSYVGSTSNFARRKKVHIGKLRKNCHSSARLQNSYNKHGEENFVFLVLKHLSKDQDMYVEEQVYLDNLQTYKRDKGYNMSAIAVGVYNEDNYRRVCKYSLSGELLGCYANAVQACDSIGADVSVLRAAKGKYRFSGGYIWLFEGEEYKLEEAIKKANSGFKFSEKSKLKMSISAKNRTPEERAMYALKISAANKGKIPKNLAALQQASRIPVFVYDKENNLLDTYTSLGDCQQKYPSAKVGKTMKRTRIFFTNKPL